MKTVTIFLLLAFIAALFTVPEHEQFNKYLNKKGRNAGTCLGGTRQITYKVFTLNYVDYCTAEAINKSNLTDSTIGIQKKIRTDKYLGLFGIFWKL